MARKSTGTANKLSLADMTPHGSSEKGVTVEAALPYDTPVRKKVVSEYPVTRKEGVAPIIRTDYK